MIKKITIALAISMVSMSAMASHYVNGYERSNGTYVQGHESMNPGESESTNTSYQNDEIVPRKNQY